MSMIVQCDGCRARMKVPSKYAGQRKRCPKCGHGLEIPTESEPQTYDLAEPEDDAGAAKSPASSTSQTSDDSSGGWSAEDAIMSSAASSPAQGSPPEESELDPVRRSVGARPSPVANQVPKPGSNQSQGRSSSFAEAVIGSVKNREDEGGPRPLLTLFGIDFTRNRLIGVGAMAVLALGFIGWWVTFGPGRHAAVAGVRHVNVVTALNQGEVREPYSLFSGTGDRSLGVKGLSLSKAGRKRTGAGKNQSKSKSKKEDHVLSVGSRDHLVVTRDDPKGRYMVVDVKLTEAFMKRLKQTDRYKLDFRGRSFDLKPANGGGQGQNPILIFEPLDGQANVDLAGAQCSDYKAVLPPKVKPSDSDLTKQSGGVASGTLIYRGEAGVRGKVDVRSAYYASGGAPGVSGLGANGMLQYTGPGGAVVTYDYAGPNLNVTWNKGSNGYWCRPEFNRESSGIPLSKHKVSLLFKRPQSDSPLILTYAGKKIGTLPATHNAPKKARTGSPGNRPSGSAKITKTSNVGSAYQPSTGSNALTGYFQVLADARTKAQGVANASNMKQLGLGIHMYAQQHDGKLPERLEDLQTVMPAYQSIMANHRTGDDPGYVYNKPAERLREVEDPAHTPLISESKGGRLAPGGAVLYADGHIEGLQ